VPIRHNLANPRFPPVPTPDAVRFPQTHEWKWVALPVPDDGIVGADGADHAMTFSSRDYNGRTQASAP